jgi:hypothetical protein
MPANDLTLYGNRESGHADKVKLFLALAGIRLGGPYDLQG